MDNRKKKCWIISGIITLILLVTITVVLVLILKKTPNKPKEDLNTRLDKTLLAWADAYKKYNGVFTKSNLPKSVSMEVKEMGDGDGLLGA